MPAGLVLSALIFILSSFLASDAQFGVPIGGLQEILPSQIPVHLRSQFGIMPRAPPRFGRMGVRQFNMAPFARMPSGIMRRPLPFGLNRFGRVGIPSRFNPNSIMSRTTMPFTGNAMRIMPMANAIRALRQQQLQQEAIRRARLAQRFRPFFNTTPTRFGVPLPQQATIQPVVPPASQIDLSRFPNFDTNTGNEAGQHLINQLTSFHQLISNIPATSRAMTMQSPRAQQTPNSMFVRPRNQFPAALPQFRLPQTASPNFPSVQTPFAETQGFGTRTETSVPATRQFPSQWALPAGVAPPVPAEPDITPIAKPSPSNIFGQESDRGRFVGVPDTSDPVSTSIEPSRPTSTNGDKPNAFDEQVTIFHPTNDQLCYTGRNLSPDLLKWIVNVLTVRMQQPDGDTLCHRGSPYTIAELVIIEKDLIERGIDPHDSAAFRKEPSNVDIGTQGNPTATGFNLESLAPPVPPSNAIVQGLGEAARVSS